MASIKVFYFDARGRAEIIRQVLTLAGQTFDDVRFTKEDWPKYKSDAPFGQAPYVEYKGKKYGQSHAIASFFAEEFGLLGESSLDRLRINEVAGLVMDLVQIIVKAMVTKDEAAKAELDKKLDDEEYPKFFGRFAKLLQENPGNDVFVGKELTLADLYVYNLVYNIAKNSPYDAAAKFPELQALKTKVEANPAMKEYLANRKETPF